MRRLAFSTLLLLCTLLVTQAQTITPWQPLYKGIDFARGTNLGPNATFTHLMVVTCLKIDLTDPDIQFLATPRAPGYLPPSRETISAALPNFLRTNGLAVASDCNFYNPSQPAGEGIGLQVYGLAISRGVTVSAGEPSDQIRDASILFTTNKTPFIVYHNQYPGTNTAGIYTAVSGFYPVLSNGVNVASWAVANYPDPTIHQVQPRTVFGLSQDRRYFFMMVIDGRQLSTGYSDGSTDTETATWLQMFGAWDGINMDGGGSSAIYRSECGTPVAMTRSSDIVSFVKHERYIGSHLGVYAKSLPQFVDNVVVNASDTSASITWSTSTPTSGNIDYGLTASYGNSTPLNGMLVTKHVATLNNL
ncbi:MAG TPA: phosphodiester glycosidase family protein, partial [Candidatus Saccharimonadales bacterium]|nr:phosphodiester glycosidase family protein [Candidatus Saccharimonadales bacterium]